MGCFGCKKKKKKKIREVVDVKPGCIDAERAAVLPEPEARSLQSAPSSFLVRSQSVNRATSSRNRVSSAPSMLAAADGAGFSAIEFLEEEESSPLPLPRPSLMLRSMGSYKSSNMSNSPSPSNSLPLPPLGGAMRNFSFEEISVACQHFSVDRCVSEGISSIVYKANFGDDSGGSKKLEATVTRLLPSTQEHWMQNEVKAGS